MLRTIDVVHLRAVAAALPTRVEAVSWQWCVPADALRMQCAMIDPALLDKSIWPIVRVANHWLVQGNIRVPLHALAMKDLEANLRNTLRAAAFVGVTACDAKPWMFLLLRQLLSPPATRSSGRPSRAMQHNVMVARTLMDQLEIALSSTANDSYVCHGVLLALLLMLLQMRPLVTKHVVVVQSYWRQHLSHRAAAERAAEAQAEQLPPWCNRCGKGHNDETNPLILCDGCHTHQSETRRLFGACHLSCEGLTKCPQGGFFCSRWCRAMLKKDKKKAAAAQMTRHRCDALVLEPRPYAEDLISIIKEGGGAAISTDGDPLICDFALSPQRTVIETHMSAVAASPTEALERTGCLEAGERNLQILDGVTTTHDGESKLHALLDNDVRAADSVCLCLY